MKVLDRAYDLIADILIDNNIIPDFRFIAKTENHSMLGDKYKSFNLASTTDGSAVVLMIFLTDDMVNVVIPTEEIDQLIIENSIITDPREKILNRVLTEIHKLGEH